jgi:hypothetical protein
MNSHLALCDPAGSIPSSLAPGSRFARRSGFSLAPPRDAPEYFVFTLGERFSAFPRIQAMPVPPESRGRRREQNLGRSAPVRRAGTRAMAVLAGVCRTPVGRRRTGEDRGEGTSTSTNCRHRPDPTRWLVPFIRGRARAGKSAAALRLRRTPRHECRSFARAGSQATTAFRLASWRESFATTFRTPSPLRAPSPVPAAEGERAGVRVHLLSQSLLRPIPTL